MCEAQEGVKLHGLGVSAGICLGTVMRYDTEPLHVSLEQVQDRQSQLELVERAWEAVQQRLQNSYEEAAGRDLKEADVFLAHLLLLTDDSALLDPIRAQIREKQWSAAWAVQTQFDLVIGEMEQSAVPYMRERCLDMRDLQDQVLRHILNRPRADLGRLEEDVVLVTKELTPSDTIRMDQNHVKGIVCQEGGNTSHTALLARAMGIPAVMGCSGILDRGENGQSIFLDGETGEVLLSPGQAEREVWQRRKAELEARRRELEAFRDKPAVTRGGRTVKVCANVARPEECARAAAEGCDGVGLFRSEFLYLGRTDLPDEEEQYQAYAAALEALPGASVTIRTLDVGGDKELPGLLTDTEANPFLGCRAIRLCLRERQLFLTQLRALYRASVHGKLRIMFPMIATLEELRDAKACAAQARKQLEAEGAAFCPDVPLGMMVEVPSAALMPEVFAREADFFSIGTNDLVQYVLAADRGNPAVARLYSPFQPAVLRLLDRIIRSAKAEGIPCCLCGGAAEDPEFLPLLVGMGLEEISVSIHNILNARRTVCLLDDEAAEKRAREALCGRTLSDTKPSNKEVDHHV